MIKVFEAFAGIGTQRMALKRLGIDHEVVAISEIDKFAIQSYEAIHGEVNNLGDITKLDTDAIPDHDLFTYSFPCQDISVAGQGKGLAEGSGTRSSLLWECERVIEAKRPKYLLLENVKNLVGKKNKPYFEKWLEVLRNYGYTNYWQVLNAKDFGIPQNRERVFVVSILGEHKPYIFPNKEKLILRLKDVLEDEVDEKYYLNNEKAEQLVATITEKNNITNPTVVDSTLNEPKTKEIMNTITARYDTGIQNYKSIGGAVIEPEIKQVLQYNSKNRENTQRFRTYDPSGIAPTLNTMQGGNLQPQIIEPKIAASRGRNPENPSDRTKGAPTEQRLEVNDEGTSNTITTVQKDNYVVEPSDKPKLVGGIGEKNFGKQHRQGNRIYDSEAVAMCLNAQPVGNAGGYSYLYKTDYRIRKLTPKECWRLMGCNDEDFYKAQKVNSNTQLYKQAGNAIVVDVLEAIFRNLFLKGDKTDKRGRR